jgi:hypothetical protein
MTNYATSEPPKLLIWDIRTSPYLVEAVVHFGTVKSVAALKRRKRLPSLEEVKAADRARRAK